MSRNEGRRSSKEYEERRITRKRKKGAGVTRTDESLFYFINKR